MARIAFHLRHPVANRLGRRLELLREIVGTTPCAHQLHHSAPVFRRIPCMTLGHRGSPSLSPLRHCPPNRVNSSLWSVDFFRCESILLKSYWIMIVRDVFTRRIIGFGVAPADLDGPVVCRMFNRAIAKQTPPKYLSSDNDPLFRFHRWRANLRILEVDEIKTIPCTPVSHPFVERLIGTVRREYLDRTLFWNRGDLERKLDNFQAYYN